MHLADDISLTIDGVQICIKGNIEQIRSAESINNKNWKTAFIRAEIHRTDGKTLIFGPSGLLLLIDLPEIFAVLKKTQKKAAGEYQRPV